MVCFEIVSYWSKESIRKPASYIIYFFPETTSGIAKMCQQYIAFLTYKLVLRVFIFSDDVLYKYTDCVELNSDGNLADVVSLG